MKIVHIIFGLKTGGAEAMLVDIVNEQSLFHPVMLVIINDSCDDSVLGAISDRVKLIRIGRPESSINPFFLLKLHWSLISFGPDVLHMHNPVLLKMLKLFTAPKFVTVHGMNVIMPSGYHEFKNIFSISEAVRDDQQSRYPLLKSTVVHNGIRFSDVPAKQSYGQQPFRIVQVGRVYPLVKGQDILLRALKLVVEKVGSGNVAVDFIGEDFGSIDFLKQLSVELGISECCAFLGKQSRTEIYQKLHQYDLLVQPSRSEGFGLTIVEAMAAKVPVLISDIEGPMEVIKHGSYGKFFKSESDNDCAEKIIQIMGDSRTDHFALEMNRIFEYAHQYYDVQLTAQNYLYEYKN